MKRKKSSKKFVLYSGIFTLLIAVSVSVAIYLFSFAATTSYSEDFSTTTYKDATNSTAIWSGNGSVTMKEVPSEITLVSGTISNAGGTDDRTLGYVSLHNGSSVYSYSKNGVANVKIIDTSGTTSATLTLSDCVCEDSGDYIVLSEGLNNTFIVNYLNDSAEHSVAKYSSTGALINSASITGGAISNVVEIPDSLGGGYFFVYLGNGVVVKRFDSDFVLDTDYGTGGSVTASITGSTRISEAYIADTDKLVILVTVDASSAQNVNFLIMDITSESFTDEELDVSQDSTSVKTQVDMAVYDTYALLAWSTQIEADTNGSGVYATIINFSNSSNVVVGDIFRPNSAEEAPDTDSADAGNNLSSPAIAVDDSGNFVFLYHAIGSYSNNGINGVGIQVFDTSGNTVGDLIKIDLDSATTSYFSDYKFANIDDRYFGLTIFEPLEETGVLTYYQYFDSDNDYIYGLTAYASSSAISENILGENVTGITDFTLSATDDTADLSGTSIVYSVASTKGDSGSQFSGTSGSSSDTIGTLAGTLAGQSFVSPFSGSLDSLTVYGKNMGSSATLLLLLYDTFSDFESALIDEVTDDSPVGGTTVLTSCTGDLTGSEWSTCVFDLSTSSGVDDSLVEGQTYYMVFGIYAFDGNTVSMRYADESYLSGSRYKGTLGGTMTEYAGTSFDFTLSTNYNVYNWETVTIGQAYSTSSLFGSSVDTLYWKAAMTTDTSSITPTLSSLDISMIYGSSSSSKRRRVENNQNRDSLGGSVDSEDLDSVVEIDQNLDQTVYYDDEDLSKVSYIVDKNSVTFPFDENSVNPDYLESKKVNCSLLGDCDTFFQWSRPVDLSKIYDPSMPIYEISLSFEPLVDVEDNEYLKAIGIHQHLDGDYQSELFKKDDDLSNYKIYFIPSADGLMNRLNLNFRISEYKMKLLKKITISRVSDMSTNLSDQLYSAFITPTKSLLGTTRISYPLSYLKSDINESNINDYLLYKDGRVWRTKLSVEGGLITVSRINFSDLGSSVFEIRSKIK